MSTIPSSLARVPTLLSSHLMLGSINRASRDLLETQVRLSSGLRVSRPSDDPIGTSTIASLDDVIERQDQRLRNLSHADAVLNNVDAALGELSGILIEAKGVAASQIGIGSDEQTRRNQATVIDAMLSEAVRLGNSRYQQLYLFGGNATADPPIVELKGGLRYRGEGDGLVTDSGLSRALPITVAGRDAFGALSERVQGNRDLDPVLSGATRLLDLNGARGLGVRLASIQVDVNGTDLTVDLTNAHTVQDILDTLETEIRTVDAGAPVVIDGATQNRIRVIPSAGFTVTINDPATDSTAVDLGIDGTFPPGGAAGNDLDPRITEMTAIGALGGVTVPLGTIRLTNIGQTRDIDLSGVTTIRDLMNAVEGADLGIRVEISESGDRLDFINALSGGAMSVGEVGGGTTATELGVRSFTGDTSLDVFNDGLGVQIREGSVDPISGLPDPAKDVDFRITLKDGTQLDVDLAGAETVQDVLDEINTVAAAAGLTIGVDFEATLVPDGNGILIADNMPPPGGTTSVASLNGSYAARDLGILTSTTSATIAGEDRATVAVDSLFSHLVALRDALETNDELGITLAGEKLEADISRVTETRADVGVRSRRVTDSMRRDEDLRIQNLSLKSQIQDLDFTEAAVRFSLLQTQLQAGLQTASSSLNLSLLDFLR